jgi:hypothetical protein
VTGRNPRFLQIFAILFLGLVLQPPPALAWNETGHRLVALVAWEALDEPARTAIIRLLKQHERFGADFKDMMPMPLDDADPATKNRWIFLQAAVWPDMAATLKAPLRLKHHHAAWHSFSQPMFLNGEDEPDLWKAGLPVNLSAKWFPSMPLEEMNALQAVHRAFAQLRDPAAPAAEKALMLTWLIHLVGDLHQPMHTVTLFSRGRFPEGDRNGASVPMSVRENLHSYWDGVLGADSTPTALETRVADWLTDDELRGNADIATRILDPSAWIAENEALASSVAYRERLVRALLEAESDPARALEPFEVDRDYGNAARRVAEGRVFEAGFRLAAMLRELIR